MYIRLAFLMSVCYTVLSIPAGESFNEHPAAVSPTQKRTKTIESLIPDELIIKIAEFTDEKTSINLGRTSKNFNKITKKRNTKNRLLKIMEHCGYKTYLQLTLSGYHVLAGNIHDNHSHVELEHAEFMMKKTLCIRALELNIRDIGDRLSELDIYLPNIHANMSPELELATNNYFAALGALFEKKSSYQKVSVFSGDVYIENGQSAYNPIEEFISENEENRIMSILSRLTIDSLNIRFKIYNPRLLFNPSIKTLSAHQEFFAMHRFPKLSGLNSIVYPEFDWDHPDMQVISSEPEVLRIARSHGVKELTLPFDLVSEVVSNSFSVKKLNILGVRETFIGQEYLTSLLTTNKPLTGLKFGEYLFPSVQSLSAILEKFKQSLNSLSLYIDYQSDDFGYAGYIDVLGSFLSQNSQLNELEVILHRDSTFSHSFLQHAVNLTSYSFESERISETHSQELFAFIATQTSLKSLSIKSRKSNREFPGESKESFFVFYEKLVAAIFANPSIDQVVLEINVEVSSIDESALLLSQITIPLVGRGLIFNSIPVDNIVSDVANGLEDGLFWFSPVNRETQILSIA